MKVFAIDPGTEESGYAILEDIGDINPVIREFGIVSNTVLLELLKTAEYDVLAIEMLQNYGRIVGKTVFETAYWVGRFCEATTKPFNRLYRRTIVANLCGTAIGGNSAVRQAIIDRLGPVGNRYNPGPTFGLASHMWSAVAVGLTHLDKDKLG